MSNHDSQQAICDTGERLFAINGYNGVGIKQILDETGIPKGSFYHYFQSKDAFAAAVAQSYFDKQNNRFSAVRMDKQDDELGVIISFFETLLREMASQGEHSGCVIGNLMIDSNEKTPLLNAKLKQLHQHWIVRMVSALEGLPEGQLNNETPPEELARMCWALWEGCVLLHKVSTHTDNACQTLRLGMNTLLRAR
eukprot:TRINITY_DN10607_c0_g1_i1.p1 TRINITY_DN10607_c0_g1~~TRINITY_DN10607_c0_g1_i1.p1  ORF type:complete len:195 (+),score=9.50 TRINITY_DN10607_c0_g1_i1:56-640(+)